MNINVEEATVSTEEANTLEIMENTMSEEEDKDEELEEDELEEKAEGKKKKKRKVINKDKTDFKKLVNPLSSLKIKNITRILEKLNHKIASFDTDLNMKIMQRYLNY